MHSGRAVFASLQPRPPDSPAVVRH